MSKNDSVYIFEEMRLLDLDVNKTWQFIGAAHMVSFDVCFVSDLGYSR